ncbi:MAG: FHA domain-containing protein [Planctomycetes bacterium]|nr:FHA domain-containing protein [Planctomycetota bacterium]
MDPIPYSEFVERHRPLSEEAFLAQVRWPMLLVPPFAVGGHDPADTPFLTNTFSPEALSGRLAGGRLMLVPVCKRDGANAFGSMVTVGRAPNNDLVLSNSNVSKFHAYLRKLGESWTVSDANSRNGTELDGKRLPAEHPFPLRSGAKIRLATLVTLEFLSPDDLYLRVRDGELPPWRTYMPDAADPDEETEVVFTRSRG